MDTQEEGTRGRGQRQRERDRDAERGAQRWGEGGRGQRPRGEGWRPRERRTETQREGDRLRKDRGGGNRDPGEVKIGMGKWGDTMFSWDTPRPWLREPLRHAAPLVNPGPAQTCKPHIAGLAAGTQEVQVSEGICGLLRGVQVTVPYGHHGCPECILHSH